MFSLKFKDNLLAKVKSIVNYPFNQKSKSYLGLASQPSQVLQQLAALQAASQQQASPMQTNTSHSPIYNARIKAIQATSSDCSSWSSTVNQFMMQIKQQILIHFLKEVHHL